MLAIPAKLLRLGYNKLSQIFYKLILIIFPKSRKRKSHLQFQNQEVLQM